MWHEARRQERKIRGMLVDYRKRAERRRDFYEKIKADPTQFLQVHGRQCKIHLDPAIAAAADSAVMMPWQGNDNNLIDRFDVRAHLDHIPPVKKEEEPEITQEERHLNYERYRIIAQNAYLGISEEKFLKQLHLEEQFGYTETKVKKEPKATGAAIGFNYEDGTAITVLPPTELPEEHFDEDNSDSDLDVDLAINVSKIDSAQAHEMNKHGQQFGMSGNDFYSFLTNDLEEAESYKLAKEEEHEKALYSGRKSRRERRAHREKRLANRKISPPSYAAKESPTNPSLRDESKSPSRSPSPDAGKITYITSFGDDEEPPPSSSKPTYADKVKHNKSKKGASSSDRTVYFAKRSRSGSREITYDRRRSGSRFRRSTSRSRSRRSRSRNRKSRSRSRSRRTKPGSYTKERSRTRSPRGQRRSSKSRNRSRSPLVKKSHSTSRSRSSSVKARRGFTRSRSRLSHSSTLRGVSKSKSGPKRSRTPSRSRSRSRRSKSKSEQRTSVRHRSASSSPLSSSSSSAKPKSKSKSPVVAKSKSKSKSPVAPAPPRIRYYGRKKSDMSSSESSSEEENDDYGMKEDNPGTSDSNNRSGNNTGIVSKRPSTTLTVIERLRLKRQALINRQFKKDKIAEVQKILREKQAQQTREDELREMAIKLRRRQRELRHAYDRSSSSDSERSDKSKRKESSSVSPPRIRDKDSGRNDRNRDRERDRDRDKERRDRDRRRSSSRDRSRRDDRRHRSRDRTRRSRSRSRSRRRYDRNREQRDGKRGRSPDTKESARKLVDY